MHFYILAISQMKVWQNVHALSLGVGFYVNTRRFQRKLHLYFISLLEGFYKFYYVLNFFFSFSFSKWDLQSIKRNFWNFKIYPLNRYSVLNFACIMHLGSFSFFFRLNWMLGNCANRSICSALIKRKTFFLFFLSLMSKQVCECLPLSLILLYVLFLKMKSEVLGIKIKCSDWKLSTNIISAIVLFLIVIK